MLTRFWSFVGIPCSLVRGLERAVCGPPVFTDVEHVPNSCHFRQTDSMHHTARARPPARAPARKDIHSRARAAGARAVGRASARGRRGAQSPAVDPCFPLISPRSVDRGADRNFHLPSRPQSLGDLAQLRALWLDRNQLRSLPRRSGGPALLPALGRGRAAKCAP